MNTYIITYAVVLDGHINRTITAKQTGNTSIDAICKLFEGCPQYKRNRFELVGVIEER